MTVTRKLAPSKVDALARAAMRAELTSEDLGSIRAWLADQLVSQQYAKLGQGGHTNTQVPLRQVFVDLPVTASPNASMHREERALFLSCMLSAGPLELRSAFQPRSDIGSAAHPSEEVKEDDEDPDQFAVGVIIRRQPTTRWGATLLIGGPGQGKSTLGQLACQLHRAALLRPVSSELSSTQRELVASFVATGSSSGLNVEGRELDLPESPLLPLQITLPDFAAWAARSTVGSSRQNIPSLLNFLADLPSARSVGLDAFKLLRLICHLPSLLVLDGFDEVGATQDRSRIVSAARELLTALSERSALCQILATTRPQGYADELSHAGVKFQKVFLAPLLREEALAYAEKLIVAKISGADNQAKALRQIHEAAAESATERLLTTPLQVTILTALVQQLGRAPRERWNLFSRYFAYTFDREIERGTYASPLLAEHRSHIERIHARVALLLQVEAERDGGAAARMTRERLEEVISEVLSEDEVSKTQRQQLIRDIASAAEYRLVFLVEPEPGKFGFEIRSLQEFMAAWALTSGRDSEVEARLQQVSKAPMFRNVALFISSRLFSEGSPLRDILADRICANLDEDSSDPLSRISRAGGLLALETLEEGAALSQPKRARALMGRAVSLLSVPPGLEHVRLACAANDDTGDVLRQALDRGLASDDKNTSFCTASAWACLIDATNRNQVWAKDLGQKHWKPSAASKALFDALARTHSPLGEWICQRIEDKAEEIQPHLFIDTPATRSDRPPSSSWASWLVRVYGASGKWRYRTRHGFLPLTNTRGRQSDPVAPEYEIPRAASWRAWIAAAQFDCKPSALTLAAALEALAENLDRMHWQRLQWRTSWPLAACIAAADDTADLLRHATLIRSGELGDTKDWIKAERSWKESIDLIGLLSNFDESVPWSLQAISIAPPLRALPSWAFMGGYSSRSKKGAPGDVLKLAHSMFVESGSRGSKERLAQICLANWRNLPSKLRKSAHSPIVWVRAFPKAASLLVPCPKGLPHNEWLSLLDACDPDSSDAWPFSPEAMFQSLLSLPNHPVLLKLAVRAIGIYADHYSLREVLRLDIARDAIRAIDLSSLTTVAARGDAAVLRIFAGLDSSEKDSELLAEVSAASADDPMIWSSVLSALKLSNLSRGRINAVLANIYGILGPNHEDAFGAVQAIRDSLQKRTSDLDSQATWNRLALPLPYPKQPLQGKLDGGIPSSPVRIAKIELQDIGGIERILISLSPPAEGSGQWAVFIGPNGAGKTTLLRSLALALRSVKDPSIWPKGAFGGFWQRIPAQSQEPVSSSHVIVTLGDGVEHRTLIRPSTSLSITQLPEQERPRLFPIFAYGCRRGSALGGAARQVNLDDDDGPEIATLFDEGADLIQAETWLVGLEGDTSKSSTSKIVYDCVVNALCLIMKVNFIEVSNQRLWVSHDGRTKIPFSCLSDGFLTNAGWFLDLIARWLRIAERSGVEIRSDFLSRMRGLVLIDEIDLHLHPRWQIDIISTTRGLLPQMSFVVTTHNPLTLVGAKAEEVWILDNSSGIVSVGPGVETPMLLTGGQIYQKYFGIADIYPDEIGRLIQRYGYLSGYAMRTDEEQRELEEAKRKLAGVGIDPGWDIVPRSYELSSPKLSPKRRLRFKGDKR